MSLIVTGTVGIDTIYTPDGQHREGVLGGSAAYFAVAANHYGSVRMVAVVGDDFPQEFSDLLNGMPNIDTAGLERRAGGKTFRWGGKYMENMDERETLFTELGVVEGEPPKIPDAFKDSDTLFLANSHPAVQMTMLESMPDLKLAVADTMNLWIDVARDDLSKLLKKVDGLVLNYEEAEQYAGTNNAVAAGKKMLEEGPTFVVIKKGEDGALLIHRDGLAALPAYPAAQVVDPTGAGDTFAAGMMAQIAKTGDRSFHGIRKAMAHGTVMASFTIETFSLERIAALSAEQLQERYDDYAAMIAV